MQEQLMIEPVGHRLLIKLDPVKDRTKGGLFVPIQAQQRQQMDTVTGELVAIGPNAWKAFDDGQPWAKIGDRVIFAKYAGVIVNEEEMMDDRNNNSEAYRFINDEDILGIKRII